MICRVSRKDEEMGYVENRISCEDDLLDDDVEVGLLLANTGSWIPYRESEIQISFHIFTAD
jgi:hypothetical protein